VSAVEVRVAPDELRDRVVEIGADLGRLYAGHDPVLVTVLNGGAVFLADLVRATPIACVVDFLCLGRYPGRGRKYLTKDLDVDVAGRHVVVVEDIVDTGLTLAYLLQVLAARRPASLRVCTLLDRAVRRIADVPLDWVGFEVGDEFLVGYGLDLDGRLRHVPAVLAATDRAALRHDPEATVRRALERAAAAPDSV
jgi:hypoxanthine phosphoribosyltransferase